MKTATKYVWLLLLPLTSGVWSGCTPDEDPSIAAHIHTTFGLTAPSAMEGKVNVTDAYLKLDRIEISGSLGGYGLTQLAHTLPAEAPPFRLMRDDTSHVNFSLNARTYDQLSFNLALSHVPYTLTFVTETTGGQSDLPEPVENIPGNETGNDQDDTPDGNPAYPQDNGEPHSDGNSNANDDTPGDDSDNDHEGHDNDGGEKNDDRHDDDGDEDEDEDEDRYNDDGDEESDGQSDKDDKEDKPKKGGHKGHEHKDHEHKDHGDPKDHKDHKGHGEDHKAQDKKQDKKKDKHKGPGGAPGGDHGPKNSNGRNTQNPGSETLDLDHFFQNARPGLVIFAVYESPGGKTVNLICVLSGLEKITVKAKQNDNFSMVLSDVNSAEVTFDPNRWFGGITSADIDAASTQIYRQQEVIFIHPDYNTALYQKLVPGIEASADLNIAPPPAR